MLAPWEVNKVVVVPTQRPIATAAVAKHFDLPEDTVSSLGPAVDPAIFTTVQVGCAKPR